MPKKTPGLKQLAADYKAICDEKLRGIEERAAMLAAIDDAAEMTAALFLNAVSEEADRLNMTGYAFQALAEMITHVFMRIAISSGATKLEAEAAADELLSCAGKCAKQRL